MGQLTVLLLLYVASMSRTGSCPTPSGELTGERILELLEKAAQG